MFFFYKLVHETFRYKEKEVTGILTYESDATLGRIAYVKPRDGKLVGTLPIMHEL